MSDSPARDTGASTRPAADLSLAAHLQLALQGSGAGPWDWDPRTGSVHRSPRVAELAGVSPGELGPDLAALVERVHTDDRALLLAACEAVAGGQRDELQVEYRLNTPGGGQRWVRDLGCVVERDAEGRPARVAGLTLDIDAQRRAEAALRDSQERLFSVVAALAEGIVYLTTDGRVELCNAAAEHILGRRAGELAGAGPADPRWLAVREDGSRIPEDELPLQSTLRTGQPRRDELVGVQRPDGSLAWLSVNTQPLLRPGEPRPHAVVASFTDVSQRKLAQQRLRESEQRFRAVADAAPALIWMSGPDRACSYFNRGWLEFTGRELEDELGSGWLEGLHPDDRQRCLESYVSAFERREPFGLDFRLRRADGEYRWVSDQGVPRFDSGGAFAGYIGVAVDVTVRKLMAGRLEEASEQLTTLVEALPDAVVFKDAAGRWQMANHAAVVLFGLEDVDWRNRSDDQLAALLPHAREGFANQRAADELAWARRGRQDSVDQFADRAGLPVYFEVSRVPLFRSSGERRVASVMPTRYWMWWAYSWKTRSVVSSRYVLE